VYKLPAAIALGIIVDSCTGTALLVRLPLPNAPRSLFPQTHNFPPAQIATLLISLAPIIVIGK
jgi:hypothetical protein